MIDLNVGTAAPDFARTKLCGTCRTRKWLPDFPRRSACKHDGRAAVCKDCHRDYMRSYVKSRRDSRRHADAQRVWRSKHIDRQRAHSAVKRAVKAGILSKPNSCADCNAVGSLEAHHEDYTRPLDVMWLCPQCHGKRHRDGNRGKK